MRVVPGEQTSYGIVLALPGVDRIFLRCPGATDTFAADDVDLDLAARARLFYFGYPPLMARMYADGGALARLFESVKSLGVTTALDLALALHPTPAVCGFPRIDVLLSGLPPRAQTLAKLDIPPDAPVVLYTSNKVAQGMMAPLLDSIRQSHNAGLQPQVYWIVKLHPREQTRAAWEAAIRQRQLSTVRVADSTADFYALLAACDIHISFTSTTLIEAAILGKLNLGLDVAQIPDPMGYAQAKAYLPVAPDQIGPIVHTLLSDPERQARLLAEQKEFAADWCLHDGHAVERIVSLVESLITPSNSGRETNHG